MSGREAAYAEFVSALNAAVKAQRPETPTGERAAAMERWERARRAWYGPVTPAQGT